MSGNILRAKAGNKYLGKLSYLKKQYLGGLVWTFYQIFAYANVDPHSRILVANLFAFQPMAAQPTLTCSLTGQIMS